jgi:hypothetical protein
LKEINPPIVVNKYKESYDVYIGRGSKYGNPFVIGKDGDREKVISLYKHHLWRMFCDGDVSKGELLSLSGKKLGCFCKPQACHGDMIVKLFEYVVKNEN